MALPTDVLIFFITLIIGFICKFLIVINLLKNHIKTNSRFYLLLFIIGTLWIDFSWFAYLIRNHFYPISNLYFLFFGVRLPLAYTIIMYHGMALFIESLLQKSNDLKMKNSVVLVISGALCLFYLCLAFYFINEEMNQTQLYLRQFNIVYQQFLLSIALIITVLKLKTVQFSAKYKKRIMFGVIPLLTILIILNMMWAFPFGKFTFANSYYYYSLSLLYTTAMLYYFSIILTEKEKLIN